MKSQVRHAVIEDAPAIAELVQAGFVEHIAADWELSAQQRFIAETEAETLAPKVAGAAVCLVCECEDRLLGVILLPRPTMVQLFFVASDHLRTGIGRTLWDAVRVNLAEKHPEVRTVELNSSPYALRAYEALGFFPISRPYRHHGAVATRMACWLPGKAFEEGQHVA